MTIQKYSKEESLDRIYRVFKGATPDDDSPFSLDGEKLTWNQALSRLAELLQGSLPGETFTIPEGTELNITTGSINVPHATLHENSYVNEFVVLSAYDPSPSRGSESNIHGGLLKIADNQSLSTGTPITMSKGIGKFIVVPLAGSDFDGQIIVSGTSIDRNTGVATVSDNDILIIDALTTDDSDTDSNGNTRHAFTGAYITSKWFHGTVSLFTNGGVNLSDVDVYHISFEQFNDQPDLTLTTFDANILTTNAAAEFDGYLYTVEVSNGKATITRIASLNVGADGYTALANKYERLRRGNLDISLDGSTDGIWMDIHYSNSPSYVEDVTIKVWAYRQTDLVL